MNDLGILLLGAALQVTVLAAAGAGLYALARRRGRAPPPGWRWPAWH